MPGFWIEKKTKDDNNFSNGIFTCDNVKMRLNNPHMKSRSLRGGQLSLGWARWLYVRLKLISACSHLLQSCLTGMEEGLPAVCVCVSDSTLVVNTHAMDCKHIVQTRRDCKWQLFSLFSDCVLLYKLFYIITPVMLTQCGSAELACSTLCVSTFEFSTVTSLEAEGWWRRTSSQFSQKKKGGYL